MKSILFNTEMVQAILEGRKTVTRRAIKPRNPIRAKQEGYRQGCGLWIDLSADNGDKQGHIKDYSISPLWTTYECYIKHYAPYQIDDILYVRETWNISNIINPDKYLYQADYIEELSEHIYPYCNWKWKPSIHMPKDAARIFLRVTNVSVARLQDITERQAKAEGAEYIEGFFTAIDDFKTIWDSTIKGEKNYLQYGWFANPWVWVIEFERIAKEDAI